MMYTSIKERGRAVSDFYAGSEDYFFLTPASLSLLQGLSPLLEKYCRGRVLDAGAGRGAYRDKLLNHAEDYVGLDITLSRAAAVVGNVQSLPFADASFDTIFCSQVLEHVADPWRVLTEFRRVLRDDGHLVLSVPHISWLHNEPHDYYRYTRHGLIALLDRGGWRVTDLAPAGGLFSLLGHIISTFLINLSFNLPVVHPLIRSVNRCWVRCAAWLDRVTEKKKLFALNYVCVAQKDLQRLERKESPCEESPFGR